MTPTETLAVVCGVGGLVVGLGSLVERLHARLTQPPPAHGVPDLERRVASFEAYREQHREDHRRADERAQDHREHTLEVLAEIRGDVARARRRGGDP